jgi:hypothetical protein
MGRVISLRQGKKKRRVRPAEGSKAEEEMVAELYRKLLHVMGGYHDVVICKAVAVAMGTLMTYTKTPGTVIGGFMKHIEAVAGMAVAHHKLSERKHADKESGLLRDPGEEATDTDQSGHAGPNGSDSPEGSDRGVEESEGQVVLLPPTIQ